ncbi:MAG: hypothetical protein GY842_24765 [bacterium]|nr:hypothetical protein [bacterium]
MKKVLCLAALAALVAPVGVSASDLAITIVPSVTEAEELDVVTYQIMGTLTDGEQGLGLVGFDFDANGDFAPSALAAGTGMDNFVKDDGLTNPDGYGGTASGNTLLQVGGGQNTIGNDVGNAPYPIGDPIDLGIANTPQELATGSFTMPGAEVTLNVTNCFANVITSDTGGPVYPVAAVDTCVDALVVVGLDPGGSVYDCPVPGEENDTCPDSDVNCDTNVNALDIAVVVSGLNWFKPVNDPFQAGDADAARADVDRSGAVNALDIAPIVSGSCWFMTP